jgi:ATP-dependent exoDNAse (exonuclease V) beta subunit
VAGPGSGKTRVLVEHFCWLVRSREIQPSRILAFTFTEKAATEIKRRLVQSFAGQAGLRTEIERSWVSTIHGFCARLLKENSVAAGIDPQFTILDERQAQEELDSAVESALDAMLVRTPRAFRNLIEALSAVDLAACLREVFEARRLDDTPPAQPSVAPPFSEFAGRVREVFSRDPGRGWPADKVHYLAELREWAAEVEALASAPASRAHFAVLGRFACSLNQLQRGNALYSGIKEIRDSACKRARQALVTEYYRSERALLHEALEEIGQVYRARKQALSALDFSDLEEYAIDLLSHEPGIRARIAGMFDSILMDELQDTNPLQWKLVSLIRRPACFFGVGDINQSIYGFRHADPEVFRTYRSDLESKGWPVDDLRDNHRSRPEILDAVQAVVGTQMGIESRPLTAARTTAAKSDPSVEVIAAVAEDTATASEIEAYAIARRISDLEGTLILNCEDGVRPARFSDFAILVRKTEPFSMIEQACREFGVPALVTGGRTFFESREVRDLLHCLRILANVRDELAIAAVLRSPMVGVSDETLLRLKQHGNLGVALDHSQTANVAPEDAERLSSFWTEIRRVRELGEHVTPDRLLVRLLDWSGYFSVLDERGRGNVDKFLTLVRESFERRPRSLADLAWELERLRETETEADAPPVDSGNAVQIMTVHAAKGLEFPVVFLASMHSGIRDSAPDICYSRGAGIGARWRDPESIQSISDPIHCNCSTQLREREQGESNRLLYVAMTRAAEHLVMSFAQAGSRKAPWPALVLQGLNLDINAPSQPRDVRFDVVTELPRPAARQSLIPACSPSHIVPVIASGGQADSTATVTGISMFAECPRRYFLSRYLGLDNQHGSLIGDEMPAEPVRMNAAELGSVVHEALAGGPCPDDPKAAALVARFRRSELGRRANRASRKGNEWEFVMAYGDLVVRGQIDLWFEENWELVLVDYKTGIFDPENVAGYSLQLRFYAAALERHLERPVDTACLYFLESERIVSVDLNSGETLDSVIQRFRAAQQNLDFPPCTTSHCFRCGFRGHGCAAGGDAQSAAESEARADEVTVPMN